jgi:cell division protein FtsQ
VSTRTRPGNKRAVRKAARQDARARRRAPARPATPVDPRVRDRWVAVRRDAGRRRLRLLVAIGVVVLLAALAGGVTVSPLLDVDQVKVTGLQRVTAAQVEEAGGIHPGDAMAWLDPSGAVTGIETLPFVRHATVTRSWPDTVEIAVTERTPVAWIDSPAGKVVVDGTGRVLVSVAEAPPGMPQLVGTKFVPGPGATIAPVGGARVAAGLTGLVALGTRSVTVTDTGVTLQLVDGPEIRMGDPSRAGVKVRAALAVLDALAGAPVTYIDVSVPTNPVAG